MNSSKRNFIEGWIVWALTIFLAGLFYHLQSISWIGNNLMLLTSGLLIYGPVGVLFYRKESFDFFEKNFSELWYSLKILFLALAVIAPPLFLANHYFQKFFFHVHYFPALRGSLWTVFFFHVLVVALPEEFFFRGYLLKRFQQFFGPSPQSFKLWGVALDKPFLLTAFVFAASHSLITWRWWHFAIFFPALAFGWLREKTNGLAAPILFHALSNVFAAWVGLHYR